MINYIRQLHKSFKCWTVHTDLKEANLKRQLTFLIFLIEILMDF